MESSFQPSARRTGRASPSVVHCNDVTPATMFGINTCVVGVGLSGLTFHIPLVLALPGLFNLHSVLERNPKTEGGKVKERFGLNVKIHTSFEDVLADPAIELVIIGTPSDTHYNFAKAALESGKHGMRSHHNADWKADQ
jgi:hypothetical protein